MKLGELSKFPYNPLATAMVKKKKASKVAAAPATPTSSGKVGAIGGANQGQNGMDTKFRSTLKR